MNDTMTYTGTLEVVTCWCGITHAIPTNLATVMRKNRDNGTPQPNCHCPLGHVWEFRGESKVAKLQRELANRDEDLRAERASHAATKGQLTKANRRAARGVCPHPECKRSFVDVARHVRTKHPELIETPA